MSSQFRPSTFVIYSAPTEWVSAVRHAQGHNFEGGFRAPPSLRGPTSCHPLESREGVSGVAGVATFSLPLPKISLLFPFSFAIDYPRLSDAPAQVAPRSLYFCWSGIWASVPSFLAGRSYLAMARVQDKQLTGRPPTTIGDRRTSGDEARNVAVPILVSFPIFALVSLTFFVVTFSRVFLLPFLFRRHPPYPILRFAEHLFSIFFYLCHLDRMCT